MIKEIYTRTPDDPFYEDGILDYSNEIEEIISQIRMIITTKPMDVMGDAVFGSDIDDLVFNTRQSASAIKEKLARTIDTYVTKSPNIHITTEINFGHSGYGSDYAVLDIYINGTKSVGFLINKD